MKKQELRHDVFRENVIKTIESFNENSSMFIKIFVVIVLAVGALSYYNHLVSIKIESAAHLSGRAQNIYINGNLDEAFVKFERVLDDYPNTPGAMQSLVYLLSDAVKNNDIDKVNKLLLDNDGSVKDPVVLSAILKLKGDVSLKDGGYSKAVKYYKKAQSSSGNVISYILDIADAYIAQGKYSVAFETLEKIVDDENIGYIEKNTVEELMALSKQKMSI